MCECFDVVVVCVVFICVDGYCDRCGVRWEWYCFWDLVVCVYCVVRDCDVGVYGVLDVVGGICSYCCVVICCVIWKMEFEGLGVFRKGEWVIVGCVCGGVCWEFSCVWCDDLDIIDWCWGVGD